ncbi:hypothetical protein UFOVP1015_44 [uncultured Caudovirales phage]|uniref:Uncharacterized protein n=1 Tax=uncultured Caudovirales phage TaxID=2100421 RepID=A0A6J5Q9M9_9CAUD|nr:hypothetical protein UFOVP1015_44 [uncultured Caudovirales phage]CAB5229280.1 hypothetical protein UFOVP1551_25 [uncultured Caudovirales phage]
MAYSTSGLTAYVEQNAMELLTNAVLKGKTIDRISKMVGVKSAETLNLMDTDAVFQADTACAFNASGTTTISQRTMTVGKMKIEEALCDKDLEAFYTQKALIAGGTYDMAAYAKEYTALKVAKIQAALEVAVWQGNAYFDGLLDQIDAAGTAIDGNTTNATTFTEALCLTIINGMFSVVPANILQATDLTLYMGWDFFRTTLAKITSTNFFHYVTDGSMEKGELKYPGTNLTLVAVHGLTGTNRMILAQDSNLFWGTDLLHEEEKFIMIANPYEGNRIQFTARLKGGTQVAFPANIVEFTFGT